MSKEHPDHHDAELAFRAYELRRESVMRDSRNAINRDFWPKSFAEVQAVTKADHPLNAAWRQTTTYWEMVYGTVKHGIVNADYFMESSGEGMFLFARVAPYLEELRREVSPVRLPERGMGGEEHRGRPEAVRDVRGARPEGAGCEIGRPTSGRAKPPAPPRVSPGMKKAISSLDRRRGRALFFQHVLVF